MIWTANEIGDKWTREDGAFVIYAGSVSGKKPWQRSYWMGTLGQRWAQHYGTNYATAASAMKAVDAIEPMNPTT